MKHRISVGALVLRDERILLARHAIESKYNFWTPPGGGVEGDEELPATAERETLEETQIRSRATRLAYIDELIDDSGRMVKFWYLAEYVSGEINVSANPATNEHVVEAGWFARDGLPHGHIFPAVLRSAFWKELSEGFLAPRKLPLRKSIF